MNTYNQIKQQIEELADETNQNGQNILKLSLKTQLLVRHRQLVKQALASLKAGSSPKTVWEQLKNGTGQVTKWIKDQDAEMQEALEQELTRLSVDQLYN